VGFESDSPELAARVANDLVTLFLQKNIETRKQLAAGTTEFLSDEAEKLRVRIAEIEQGIAEFKVKNYDRLPEFAQSNTQMLQGAIQEARDIDSRMQALNQQIGFLDAQLAQIEPRMPAVTESGQTIMSPRVRLRALREQYVAQLALYTPKHPSVASLKREIYGLELQTGGANAAVELLGRIEQGYTQLAAARNRSPSDEAEIARLEVRWARSSTSTRTSPSAAGATCPRPSAPTTRPTSRCRRSGRTRTERSVLARGAASSRRGSPTSSAASSRRPRSRPTTAPCSANCRASRASSPTCARSCSTPSSPRTSRPSRRASASR
jgi:polysaccharide biosynthesis transport protein